MTFRVVLSPEAEADLEEAAIWYESKAKGLGTEMVLQVRKTLEQVYDHPEAYPELRPKVRRAQVKRFSYGVFYRLREDRVDVIGIFHDRRSPRAWQRRFRKS